MRRMAGDFRKIRVGAGVAVLLAMAVGCSRQAEAPMATKAEGQAASAFVDGLPMQERAEDELKEGGRGVSANSPAKPSRKAAAGAGMDRAAAPPALPAPLAIAGTGMASKGGGGTPVEIPQAPPPQQDVAIDPNGRFATTYRPGGGHLSAFESAVARGIVPPEERELVSDVGARYAVQVAVPKDKSLGMKADLERGKAPPSGGIEHVRIALQSTERAPTERPHLSVHLVLDVSGSMAGDSIENARRASQALVDKLAPTDDFSLVTFSSDAEVLIPDGPVGPRRAKIKETIAGIKEGGGTNIGAGLSRGYAEAATASIPKDAVRVVLLLSDGRVNAGILSKGKLSQLALDAFQGGVQTSTFGLGADYDGPLMSSIAADGAGGYYYLRDSEQIAPALVTELEKRLDPVATAVELRVRLKPGVELLQVYGSRRLSDAEAARVRAQEVASDVQAAKRDGIARDRQDEQEGGMRFFMPAFARDDAHTLLLKVRVPEGVGSKPLALVELKYKDRVSKKNVADEMPLSIVYAQSDAESGGSIDRSVSRTIQGFAAGEALAEAASLIERGDRTTAQTLLSERENILRLAATQLEEPLFLKDADRLARLRSHVGSNTGLGQPLVLSMLLETSSRVHLH